MLPAALRETPEGFEAASELVTSLDEALMAGFARLGPNHKAALERVGAALTPSPLGPAVAEAVAAIRAGPPAEAHLITLAAARESLQGAMHDALYAAALTLLGRPGEVPAPATQITSRSGDAAALTSARQWLVELALGGLVQADPGSVTPFLPNLERLQEDRSLTRTTALLTGFYDELIDRLPLQSPDEAPVRRWGDLWSRALLSCTGRVESAVTVEEKGRFSCFAIDIRHHAHLVSAVLWGLWEPAGGPPRLARSTLSGWRVPAIAGPESWHALKGPFGPLLQALAERRAWDASASVLSTGDLRLQRGAAGPPVDLLETARRALGAALPVPAPTDRHPVQIGLPVVLEAPCKGVAPCVVPFGDGELTLSFSRTSSLQGVEISSLSVCFGWVGLLRWDAGEWTVSPLMGRRLSKGQPYDVGPLDTLAAELKGTSEALGILKERAGKLLRAKS